jgi:hypothetical protein
VTLEIFLLDHEPCGRHAGAGEQRGRSSNSSPRISSISRPSWMIPTRVASRSTSPRMWLDMKTVTSRSRAIARNPSRTSTTPAGSSPFAGSSRMSSSGSWSIARASPSRCKLPSESVRARRFAYGPSARRSITRSVAPASPTPYSRRDTSRFSRTVSWGYALGVSTRCPTLRHGPCPPATRSPKSESSPDVGRIMPSSARMVVVFPAPFRPRKP